MSEVEERNQSAAKRRAEAEAAYQQRELEVAQWQQMLDEQQRMRIERAETARLQHQETYRRVCFLRLNFWLYHTVWKQEDILPEKYNLYDSV